MALTYAQALTVKRIHPDGCTVTYGKTGKARPTLHVEEWRRNGRTKTWKTRPTAFEIPVKFGLRSYSYVTDAEAYRVHDAAECAAVAEVNAWHAAYNAWLAQPNGATWIAPRPKGTVAQ